MYSITLAYKYIIIFFSSHVVNYFLLSFFNTVDNERGQISHSEMFTKSVMPEKVELIN